MFVLCSFGSVILNCTCFPNPLIGVDFVRFLPYHRPPGRLFCIELERYVMFDQFGRVCGLVLPLDTLNCLSVLRVRARDCRFSTACVDSRRRPRAPALSSRSACRIHHLCSRLAFKIRSVVALWAHQVVICGEIDCWVDFSS